MRCKSFKSQSASLEKVDSSSLRSLSYAQAAEKNGVEKAEIEEFGRNCAKGVEW